MKTVKSHAIYTHACPYCKKLVASKKKSGYFRHEGKAYRVVFSPAAVIKKEWRELLIEELR